MSFSFIDIEEKKSRIIGAVFFFAILFYFLNAYFLLIIIGNLFDFPARAIKNSVFYLPSLEHTFTVLIIAFVAAILHWMISTTNLIQKVSLAVGALPIDPKDTYHQYFKNIVGEVSVAIGGRPIKAEIIQTAALNAFSLQDFNGSAVIGVTEGLLSHLNRYQIEAIVGHEAGHIVAGDALTATVICSLSEIYEEGLSKIKSGIEDLRGRASPALLLIYSALSVMHFFSSLLRYFISRQREYRADAIAVRLTRNPLSLAEALKLISKHWRGSGAQGERLESIFILNPRFNKLDEGEGSLSDIFSTHPPVNKRIDILLKMAHLDAKTLEESLKNFKKTSPVAAKEFKPLASTAAKKWFILNQEQKWLGPFLLKDLKNLGELMPDQWVRAEGREETMRAAEDADIKKLFLGRAEKETQSPCPHCNTDLSEINYEGTPVFKCSYCEGIFTEPKKVSRILMRKDSSFSSDIVHLAETILNSKQKYNLKERDAKSVFVIDCPSCRHKMRRQFFVYSHPVEIDRCRYCSGIWFDKHELELLQYLYGQKKLFFDEKGF